MPRLVFTAQLQRFTATPELHTQAGTLGAALHEAFAVNPRLRGYVLDEQGHLRPHVAVFIGAQRARDRRGLSDPLPADSTVYVLQALSGG